MILLKELKSDEQPSHVVFDKTAFWVWMYNLSKGAGKENAVKQIYGRLGVLLKIDKGSLEGFARSVRVKVKIDIRKSLCKGIHLEVGNGKIWVKFKYEQLHS